MGRITPAERPLPRFERLVELLDAGCSTAEAVDYAATAEGPWTQTAWAEVRGIRQNAVSKNVAGAREELAER